MTTVGEYYILAKFGGQTIRVQVDTGSAITAVPLKECLSCPKGGLRYAKTLSRTGVAQTVGCNSILCNGHSCSPTTCGGCSTSGQCCALGSNQSCGFRVGYVDGSSAQGNILIDEVQLVPGVRTTGQFGGILSYTGNFQRAPVDGILGLAYSGLSCVPTCMTPIFDSYVKSRVVNKDMFALCIEETSGALILGGYDSSLGNTPVRWTQEANASGSSRNYYKVELGGGIEIAGLRVNLPDFNFGMLDSGTMLIVMSTAAFNGIRSNLLTHHCNVPRLCQSPTWFSPASCIILSNQDLRLLPVLKFSIGSVKVTLGPSDYMVKYTVGGVSYRCVGIHTLPSVSPVQVILGNVFMMPFIIVHDRQQHRIGIQKRRRSCQSYGQPPNSTIRTRAITRVDGPGLGF
uniref:Peptidase A1 domain-containing protein n=2 Tax=Compsopogon caeruleus TaxID=31354 RepID=A0A7S1TJH1_9RHOD